MGTSQQLREIFESKDEKPASKFSFESKTKAKEFELKDTRYLANSLETQKMLNEMIHQHSQAEPIVV